MITLEEEEDIHLSSSKIMNPPSSSIGRYIDEYISQTPSSLRNLLQTLQVPEDFSPGVTTYFGCVMICDVSGFTRLSTSLNLEELRYHMNSLFSDLLGSIERFGGDSIKLCGDAILSIWTIPNENESLRHVAVRKAVACGRYILENFGVYENNSKSVPVSLRLHCGLSAGILHCMYLGTEHRMEWLISGPQLRDMGLAAGDAKAGQLCISPEVLTYLPNKYHKLEKTINGNYLMTTRKCVLNTGNVGKEDSSHSALSSPLARIAVLFGGSPSNRTKRISPHDDDGVSFRSSRRKDSVQHLMSGHPYSNTDVVPVSDINRSILKRFIHECARPHIILSDTNFLAEIRHVVTVFIELLNIQDDFDSGEIERPQLALTTVLEVLHKVGGVLRQYVVDDKGIVIICSFGLPNFNYSDNELKAVIASLAILSSLEQCDILCRIGISAGQAYCGYVGSEIRKEYCVMGSSVNLAARLMSKANSGQILVSGAIFEVVEDYFLFKTHDKILAKGYSEPIQVYSPIRKDGENYNGTFTSSHSYHKDYMIGRQSELSLLKATVALHNGAGKQSSSVHNSLLCPQISLHTIHTTPELGESNRILILAPEGFGKSMLISTLCKEVKALKTVSPVLCTIRMEPYQCMFSLICSLLNLFNPYTSDKCQSFETGELSPPMRDFFEALSAWIEQYNISLPLSLPNDNNEPTLSVKDDSAEYIKANDVLPVIKNLLISSLLSLDDWEVDRINIFLLQVTRQIISNSPGRPLIVEDIEWCDIESYNILMKLMNTFDGGVVIFTMSQTQAPRLSTTRSSSFTNQVNLTDLQKIFKIMELRRFTLNEIKVAIRKFVGPSLLASNPEVLSEETAHMIQTKSDGIPSLVVSKLQSLAVSLKSKSGSQSSTTRTSVWETDGLELDCRIVLKVASVCGAVFSSSLITSILEDLDYKDIADSLERIFSILQRKRLIRTTYSGVPYLNPDRNSSDPSISHPRGPASYCFVEKATLESIYGSLLDSQREAMHASIARGVEADYYHNPAVYSENITIFLAYHWSRAGCNYIRQKVYYYQLAAELSSDSKLFGDTRSYYEQLIAQSLHCLSVEAVLKTYSKVSSLVKTRTHADENPLRPRNSFSINVLCLNRYLSRDDFQGPVTSDCPFISLTQLSSYFFELSAIEFNRHAYLLSRNLFEFAFFVGGYRLQIASTLSSPITYFHVFSKLRMRKIIAQNFLNHATMSLLRGRSEESLYFIKSALNLVDTTNYSHQARIFSVYAIILLSRGNISKSQKLWHKVKKLLSKELVDSITLSYLQLYSALHHLCFGEFSLAERELSVNRTLKSDGIDLIPTCSKLLEAWLSFISGNCRRVENFTIPSSSTADSTPEWLLHDIWCRQLRVILYGFKGNYILAKRDLSLLDALQSSQFPKFSQKCLMCFIEVCENQYSSSQRNQLSSRMVSLTESFDINISNNLLCILLSFLTASCCCILLEKTPIDQLEPKCTSSFISFTFKIISHLDRLSSTYRFVILLKEVLQMKLYYLYISSRDIPLHPLSSTFIQKISASMTSFFERSPDIHSISSYPDFTFGSALWNVEMVKILRFLNFGQSFIEQYSQNALKDLKQYNIPRDHPFAIDL